MLKRRNHTKLEGEENHNTNVVLYYKTSAKTIYDNINNVEFLDYNGYSKTKLGKS